MPVIRVYVEDEILSFEGESILLVDAEEVWRNSTTPPRLLLNSSSVSTRRANPPLGQVDVEDELLVEFVALVDTEEFVLLINAEEEGNILTTRRILSSS